MPRHLTLFDLDGTLLPTDSDHAFGEFLVRIGWADGEAHRRANDRFYADYLAGRLDMDAYVDFATAPWRRRGTAELADVTERFLADVARPALHPAALALVQRHRDAGDLIAIVTATNEFVTRPIAGLFGIEHLIATELARDGAGQVTGAIRGTPALIQLFLLYFGGPQIGIQLDAFSAGVIGLGVNIGAYMTETIRGAIVAVDKGQTEAARTLGLSRWQAMRKVVIPQAARLMVRPLGVNINALIKGTALVAPISVIELTYTAQRYIGSTYKPFEMFMISGALYMVIIYVTGHGVAWLDRRVRIA